MNFAPTADAAQTTESRGRAVFATRAFTEGEQVLRERPLVAIQVCARGLSHTGCSIPPIPNLIHLIQGPPPLQGFWGKAEDESGALTNPHPNSHTQHKRNRKHARVCACCLRYVGSLEFQVAGRLLYPADGGWREDSDDDDDDDEQRCEGDESNESEEEEEDAESEQNSDEEQAAGDVRELDIAPETLQAMLRGSSIRTLPLADKFDSPTPVPCNANCGELYCSQACRDRHWSAHHLALCPAKSEPLGLFQRHANAARCAADDVLHLAAQCVTYTLLRAKELVGDSKADDAADWIALQTAWTPFAMGCKQVLFVSSAGFPVESHRWVIYRLKGVCGRPS